MKLNLGCGNDIKRGWINLDLYKREGIDIIHDLNEVPLPFYDNEFDIVLCKDVLEHINYIPLINDIYRILKKNGILIIKVPHFTSKHNFDDPTHINQFSINTFNYFIENDYFKYNRNVKFFNIIKSQIAFYKKKKFLLKILNNFLEKWVNKSNKHQILYEISILRIFPAESIIITLKK